MAPFPARIRLCLLRPASPRIHHHARPCHAPPRPECLRSARQPRARLPTVQRRQGGHADPVVPSAQARARGGARALRRAPEPDARRSRPRPRGRAWRGTGPREGAVRRPVLRGWRLAVPRVAVQGVGRRRRGQRGPGAGVLPALLRCFSRLPHVSIWHHRRSPLRLRSTYIHPQSSPPHSRMRAASSETTSSAAARITGQRIESRRSPASRQLHRAAPPGLAPRDVALSSRCPIAARSPSLNDPKSAMRSRRSPRSIAVNSCRRCHRSTVASRCTASATRGPAFASVRSSRP